jgi:hypothetical protein
MPKKAKKVVVKKKATAKKVARRVAVERVPEQVSISTLRPGYLVGLKTSVTGNVSYAKEVIEPERIVRSGAAKAKWQTERTVTDPEEHVKASQVRMKARMCIVNVCAKSAFGLLCPKADITKLNEAVAEATRLASEFNKTSKLTRIDVRVLTGEIAHNGVQAARAINSEMREIMANMAESVKNLDAKGIRDAVKRAKDIDSMLTPDTSKQVNTVIAKVRVTARKITKAGEDAAQEIDREAVKAIAEARTAFLDMDMDDDDGEIEIPEAPGRELDLVDMAQLPPPAVPVRRRRAREPA